MKQKKIQHYQQKLIQFTYILDFSQFGLKFVYCLK